MTARAVGESDTPSVLAVVLDCNPLEWATRTDEDLPALLEQLLIFANAFWMLSSANRLLVIGAHPAAARQLWPETPERAAEPAPPHRLRRALARGVDELLALDATSPPTDGRPLLAPALSLATLRIQRARREQPLLQPRVLVVHASADEPSEHLRLVDLAFANQKLEILSDSVLLHPRPPSLALQQLSHLSGGLHLHADAQATAALAVYLIAAMLPDQFTRKYLQPSPQGKLETRGLCMLTRKHVDVGWACSVCLAVFSTHTLRACAVCGTRFPLPKPPPGLKPLMKKRPAPPGAGRGAGAGAGPGGEAGSGPGGGAGRGRPMPAPPNRGPR